MKNVYITGIDLTKAKKVLLIAEDALTLNDAIEVRNVVNERFPEIEWTILDGLKAVVVKEDTPDYDFEVEDD